MDFFKFAPVFFGFAKMESFRKNTCSGINVIIFDVDQTIPQEAMDFSRKNKKQTVAPYWKKKGFDIGEGNKR